MSLPVLALGAIGLAAGVALAGNGVGGVFNLGQTNAVHARTVLYGSTATQQLAVVNNSTAAGSTAILGQAGVGYGVRGAVGAAGVNIGIYGSTASLNGFAGYFRNTNPSTTTPLKGAGIRAFAAGAPTHMFNNLTYAAGGEFAGPNGFVGISSEANQGAGVAGYSGEGDYGVVGVATNADAYAGYFENRGGATAGTGIGAFGTGVTGTEFGAYSGVHAGGVFAGPFGIRAAPTATVGAAIMALQGRGGLAIYAEGDSTLTGHVSVGTLSKGSGTFRIDHPLDPANKIPVAFLRRIAGHEECL